MIKLILKREIILDDNPPWMFKEDWEEVYKDNLPALKKLFEEDIAAFWDALGGFNIVEKAEWVDTVVDNISYYSLFPKSTCSFCGSDKPHWVCDVEDEKQYRLSLGVDAKSDSDRNKNEKDTAKRKIPNPGSDEVIKQNCCCAVVDNCYGNGAFDGPEGTFWIAEDCPLHGSKSGYVRWESNI